MENCESLRFLGGSSERAHRVTERHVFTNMCKRNASKRNARSLEKEKPREICSRIMGVGGGGWI